MPSHFFEVSHNEVLSMDYSHLPKTPLPLRFGVKMQLKKSFMQKNINKTKRFVDSNKSFDHTRTVNCDLDVGRSDLRKRKQKRGRG